MLKHDVVSLNLGRGNGYPQLRFCVVFLSSATLYILCIWSNLEILEQLTVCCLGKISHWGLLIRVEMCPHGLELFYIPR